MTNVVATNVLHNVWVGNADSVRHRAFFLKTGIQCILNTSPSLYGISSGFSGNSHRENIDELNVMVYDTPSKSDLKRFLSYLPVAVEFLYKTAILEKKKILVVSDNGRQRSCAVIVAFLIRFYKMDVDDAVQYVCKQYPHAFDGGKVITFLPSLKAWYSKCNSKKV